METTTAKTEMTEIKMNTRHGERAGCEYTYTTGCCGEKITDRVRGHHAPRTKVRCPKCKGWNQVDRNW